MSLLKALSIGIDLHNLHNRNKLSRALKEAYPDYGLIYDELLRRCDTHYYKPQYDLANLRITSEFVHLGLKELPFSPFAYVNSDHVSAGATYKEAIKPEYIYPNVIEFLARVGLWFSVGQMRLEFDLLNGGFTFVYDCSIGHWGLENNLQFFYISNMLRNVDVAVAQFQPGFQALTEGKTAEQAIQAIQTSGARPPTYRPSQKDLQKLVQTVSQWLQQKGVSYSNVPVGQKQQMVEVELAPVNEQFRPKLMITNQGRVVFDYFHPGAVPENLRLSVAGFLAMCNMHLNFHGGNCNINLDTGELSFRIGLDNRDIEYRPDTRILDNMLFNGCPGYSKAGMLFVIIDRYIETGSLYEALELVISFDREDGRTDDRFVRLLNEWLSFIEMTGQPVTPKDAQLLDQRSGVSGTPQAVPQPQQSKGSRTFGAYRSKSNGS